MRISIFIVAVCFVVDLLLDWYLVRRSRAYGRETRKKWPSKAAWSVVYVSGVLLLVLAIIPRRWADVGILCSMWVLYGWLSFLVGKICFLIFGLIGQLISLITKKRCRLGIYVGLPLAIFLFLGMWWGALFNTRSIETQEVMIVSKKIPESFDGYRIVQFSDIHVGTWGNDTTFVNTLVDSINAMQPDLIVFTGDIVNRQTNELEPFIRTLSRLKAKGGVMSVLGNHDYGDYISWKTPEEKTGNLENMRRAHGRMGWKLLENSHIYIRNGKDSIALVGVGNWGEPPFSTYGDLGKALVTKADTVRMKDDARFRILLSHNPEHWRREVMPDSDIDLTLAGHTHAMQMMFALGGWRWSPSKYKYEQWGGLYWKENGNESLPRIYVNIGCGEVGFPARIGAAYPELTLITLRSK